MSWKKFFLGVKKEWVEDRLGDVAAALTFYAILALFPFLLFVVSLSTLFIDPDSSAALIESLSRVAPPDVTSIVGGRIEALAAHPSRGLITVSIAGAIWAASSAMAALIRSLNTAYGVNESRPFWKVRGIALLATLSVAILSVAATAVAVALPALGGRAGPLGQVAVTVRLGLAGLLMMLAWALLYYFLPNADQKFRFFTVGSVVGVVIWLIASWGFSVYVSHFGNFDVTFGALGGVIVLLMWMWISSQVVLLGAVINAVLEERRPART